MNNQPRRLRLCRAIFRRLVSAYPHEFSMRRGEDLDRLGEDAIRYVSHRHGLSGLTSLLADTALRLPATYALELRQDAAYALRLLAKSPGFTSVAVLSLAIGIGMCSAVLSESRGIVAPPPGVHHPSQLLTVRAGVSYPYFERYREQSQVVVAATALMSPVPFAVAYSGDPRAHSERFYGQLVSPEYFTTLGATPAAGRFFSPVLDRPGMPPAVVVSDRFWRMHLGADLRAVGRQVRLNGHAVTIVGIGPRDFHGLWPGNAAELFVPVTTAGSLAPELAGDVISRADRETFRVVLRLRRGVKVATAEAALDAVTRHLDRVNQAAEPDRKGRAVRLIPAGTALFITPEQRAFLDSFNVSLWGLVLALVCANLASLLLARGSQRRREIAVRLSVGASRSRLVRQFLTESALLSLCGGLIGLVLAYAMTNVLSSLPFPSAVPMEVHMQPDVRLIALTLAISVAAGIGFGLAPAVSSARFDLGLALKEGCQAPLRGYKRLGARNLFVIGQMAASLMLLLGTLYVVTAFVRDAGQDPGFETAHLNLVSLDLIRDGYSAQRAVALLADLPTELSAGKSFGGVTLTDTVPFAPMMASLVNTTVTIPAAAGHDRKDLQAAARERVGAGYFATVGVPLMSGRDFERRDLQTDRAAAEGALPAPAIVNQTAARQWFGGDPLGRLFHEGDRDCVVVGVAQDSKTSFFMARPVAKVYLPMTAECIRTNALRGTILLLRGSPGADALAALRAHMASLHPDVTLISARTMRDDVDRMNHFLAWDAAIYECLGLFALLLASVGLGGVTAYAVVRRRREIGIRMALGARAGQVLRLVLREGTALLAIGAAIGFAGALALLRAFRGYSEMLARSFGHFRMDPLVLFGAPLLLIGLAMLACYLPARRATRFEPIATLREE